MSSFLWFVLGLFVGANVGLVVIGLAFAARRGDDVEDQFAAGHASARSTLYH